MDLAVFRGNAIGADIACRVATGQGKVREIQGQGKVREFCNWSGKFGILRKVREFWNWSGKFDFLMSYAQ